LSAESGSRKARYISAVIGIPFGLGTCLFLPRFFNIVVIAFLTIGMVEYYSMARSRGFAPFRVIGISFSIAIALLAWAGRPITMLYALAAGIIIIYTFAMARNEKNAMANIAVTVFGVLYVGWFCSHIILLRKLPIGAGEASSNFGGAGYVIILLILLWLGDSGAFFAGTGWGRHKLIPAISPNKTIEGSIGGFVITLVGAVLIKDAGNVLDAFGVTLFPDIGYAGYLLIGSGIGIVGQIGDLCESYIKRDAGLKDTGNLFPGHGGFLDRFDSLLFSAPLFYYFLKFAGL
jgi:phosphatidate cytidylyltransferase